MAQDSANDATDAKTLASTGTTISPRHRRCSYSRAEPDPGKALRPHLKLATYNVNGINGRLPVLLRWLQQSRPDVVCLQELKATQDNFPLAAIDKAGYGAIWHGQKSWNGVAILARDRQPDETRRGLPGDPDDTHSRYIEAEIDGVLVGCLYLPNGNPAPGPKFDYRLRWFERFADYARELALTTSQ